jgi:hypothetical protein
MGVITLGNSVTVTTGVEIETLPVVSPINIVADGAYSDSYWTISGAKIIPDDLNWTVGLGTVSTTTIGGKYLLLYDSTANEIKKISASNALVWSNFGSTPTTLVGYGITDTWTADYIAETFQPISELLTNISALTGDSGYIKKTGTYTLGLDTNEYSLSDHDHAELYEPLLYVPDREGLVLTSDTDGNKSWIAQTGGTGGSGMAQHGSEYHNTLNNAVFSGSLTWSSVALTTTFTKLNYLTSATGTTGTTNTKIVFSTSPTLTTPNIGVATGTSLNVTGDVVAYSS